MYAQWCVTARLFRKSELDCLDSKAWQIRSNILCTHWLVTHGTKSDKTIESVSSEMSSEGLQLQTMFSGGQSNVQE